MPACPYCHDDPARPVLATWSFVLPIEARSQNRLSGNKGGQRFAYQSYRRDVELLVKNAAQNLAIPPAGRVRRVRLVRLYGHRGRAFDVFNLVGGLKPVLDALVTAGREERDGQVVQRGLLWDDSPKWCIPHADQRRAGPGDNTGILVELEELA